ncbi:MAG: hypothetical protein ACE5J5_01460 [Candidatus Hydrothermarchaeales archaeon]
MDADLTSGDSVPLSSCDGVVGAGVVVGGDVVAGAGVVVGTAGVVGGAVVRGDAVVFTGAGVAGVIVVSGALVGVSPTHPRLKNNITITTKTIPFLKTTPPEIKLNVETI